MTDSNQALESLLTQLNNENPNFETIETIVEQNPYLANIQNIDKYTLLHLAASKDSIEFAELLISINPELLYAQTDRDLKTPLHFAAENKCCEMAKLLISYGSDIYLKDGYGKTPLDIAKTKNRFPLVQILTQIQENPKVQQEMEREKLKELLLKSKLKDLRGAINNIESLNQTTASYNHNI